MLCFEASAGYSQAIARKLCDGNIGLGESRTGSPFHLQCLRFFIECILWVSLKTRLEAAHSKFKCALRPSHPVQATLLVGRQNLGLAHYFKRNFWACSPELLLLKMEFVLVHSDLVADRNVVPGCGPRKTETTLPSRSIFRIRAGWLVTASGRSVPTMPAVATRRSSS